MSDKEILIKALQWIANKADNAKDNPRQQTNALFDIMEVADKALKDATAKQEKKP